MIEKFRSWLYSYVGTGWTETNSPLGLYYLSRIEKADLDELIEIANELGVEVVTD